MPTKPKIAVPLFPGSNGEIDNLQVLRRCGFDAFLFRWNDSVEKLKDCDGYFFGAGFSYEDRGRSGMVAARDPLFQFLHTEADRGKVIIGNCNGAQVLIESGLVPLGDKLRMSLAHNAIKQKDAWVSPGFLNEWVWITPSCDRNRCATSDWTGAMHIPIAHGEGRFVTKDPDLIAALEENGQVAFRYCDANGNVSADAPITPNGSTGGIAGICNPQGNVIAIMPHPERTTLGDAYFLSAKRWIEQKKNAQVAAKSIASNYQSAAPANRAPRPLEIFIDTIITNNEERTVEAAAHRVNANLKLKQYRYIAPSDIKMEAILETLSVFNPNKEIAYVRKDGQFYRWNSGKKELQPTDKKPLAGISLLRRNEPDTGAARFGKGSETGVCYDCRSVDQAAVMNAGLLEVFGNPHASTIESMQ
ncbi:MAG: phosphoribosylformylglycinamidine synthase subunit PurQ [Candidatus Peribacteraceae bacterium]|nr:phosphoribosylformylglycinamidine synthase subunit PurQ [Candidatus Peribacteraceae bacterium]